LLLSEHQFTVVAADALDRITAVHGAASLAKFASLLLGSIRTEDNVLRGNPQRPQETYPELMSGPDVQHLGDSDAQLRAVLSSRCGGMLLCEPGLQYWDRHVLSFLFRP